MITKMVLVPAESQTGGAEEPIVEPEPEQNPMDIDMKKRIERNPQKIQRLLKIILKIALNNSYTDNLEIRDIDGNPITDSNISDLLNSAISNQKVLIGEKDFIRLLFESNVDPKLIINENMRNQLINYKPKKPKPPPVQPTIDRPIPRKRKIEDSEENANKQRIVDKSDVHPWDMPLGENDDEFT
jgi:hypothetical protein